MCTSGLEIYSTREREWQLEEMPDKVFCPEPLKDIFTQLQWPFYKGQQLFHVIRYNPWLLSPNLSLHTFIKFIKFSPLVSINSPDSSFLFYTPAFFSLFYFTWTLCYVTSNRVFICLSLGTGQASLGHISLIRGNKNVHHTNILIL